MKYYDKIIAYDLETTGLSNSDQIIEIGAVAFYPKSKKKEYFTTLVYTKAAIHPKITSLTGISNETFKIEKTLSLKNAVLEFNKFCRYDTRRILFVGHNIKSFDNRFMNRSLDSFRLPRINPNDCWDTLLFFRKENAKKHGRNKSSGTLESLCTHYRIKMEKPTHRALPDAKNALQIYSKQYKINNRKQ